MTSELDGDEENKEPGQELEPVEVEEGTLEDGRGHRQRITFQRRKSFSGPLPHPEIFKGYNDVLPGAAERILAMTEKSLDHTIEMDRYEAGNRAVLTDAEASLAKRAQSFTFIIVLVFLALAAYAISQGQEIASIAAGLAGLGTIAWALWGRSKAEREDQDKDDPDASEQSAG